MHAILRRQHRDFLPRPPQRPLDPLEEAPLQSPGGLPHTSWSRSGRARPVIGVSERLELVLVADGHDAPAQGRGAFLSHCVGL